MDNYFTLRTAFNREVRSPQVNENVIGTLEDAKARAIFRNTEPGVSRAPMVEVYDFDGVRKGYVSNGVWHEETEYFVYGRGYLDKA